jgi:PleD family two-component response regulator
MLGRRVREGIRAFNLSTPDAYRLEASLGVARSDPDDRSTLAELLTGADRAMYEEKRMKRKAVAS